MTPSASQEAPPTTSQVPAMTVERACAEAFASLVRAGNCLGYVRRVHMARGEEDSPALQQLRDDLDRVTDLMVDVADECVGKTNTSL